MDLEYIEERRKFLIDQYHSARVAEQLVEQTYYDDTFAVNVIKSPQYLSRTGTGARLINGPTSHIVTRNPQVFVGGKKPTEKAHKSAYKVNALLNHWVRIIQKQIPQPYTEFVKKLLLRGEAWVHPIYDEGWNEEGKTLPIMFLVPDPLNVFSSPTGEDLVVEYHRSPWEVEMKYPDWTNPKHAGQGTNEKMVTWFEYWTKDERYFEADGEPVLKGGIQENILGFIPYVHAYSGFGDSSPEGKPESLVVGRLRRVQDLLIQECALNSDIDSTIHKFAKPRIDLILPAGAEYSEEELKENYDMGAGALNVVPLPEGGRFDAGERILPTQEAFQHLYNIRIRIAQEAPPIMSGLPSGSSGRQEDIIGYHFIRRFDSVVEATEIAFGKAFDMGREMLKVVPGWLPINQWLELPDGSTNEVKISKSDLDAVTDSTVALKAADPIEDDRKLMSGRALKKENLIDWNTFLVQYAGYTPEQANEIIEQTIADTVIMQNPILFQALAEKALENLGMHEQLERLRGQSETQEQMAKGLEKPESPQGGEPRNFNVQSPEALEQVDMMLSQRGVRRPPV
tara:strand:- start:1268 stop:2971 length:1704 start_codon:yes stop_codon:yes gene_type:complete